MRVRGYARLSRDEDKENYSSIVSQSDIITEYALKKGWPVEKIYIDDNHSGYSFNRPAFKEMRQAVENDEFDIIIAKDLSRIGRHNAKTLLFIEEIKEMGKNLILVEEGSNGYNANEDDDDIIGIKTWYNERYVRDISRKIRSSMHLKQRKGQLIMREFYGYRKDPKDGGRLIIDEEIAEIVRLIFSLYIDGMGYRKIVKILEERGCPTPSAYFKRQLEQKGRVMKGHVNRAWETFMISRIVKDDVYIGTLRCGKTRKMTIKGKTVRVDKDSQYVFENHHEPVISREDFELARRINEKRNNTPYRGNVKHEYIFSGFVFCKDCGSYAVGRNIRRSPARGYGYQCGGYNRYGRDRCTNHSISEHKLLVYFKEHLIFMREELEAFIKSLNFDGEERDFDGSLKKLEKELEIQSDELKLLLNQKIKDIFKEQTPEYRQIIENSYRQLEDERKKGIRSITRQVMGMKSFKEGDMHRRMNTAMELYASIIESEKPDKKILEIVLKRILITRDKKPIFELGLDIDKIITKSEEKCRNIDVNKL